MEPIKQIDMKIKKKSKWKFTKCDYLCVDKANRQAINSILYKEIYVNKTINKLFKTRDKHHVEVSNIIILTFVDFKNEILKVSCFFFCV